MSFQISPDMDKNKVFLVRSSEIEGRLDPFYYLPNLVELDRKIKSKTNYSLKKFTLFRASGATPTKSNDDYYADKKSGIPFIRVQNLSVTGELDTKDLVYISRDIHEGLLKRSKVTAYDLLVKITGVGRMAVASVVPDGFEGNINQHIVIIRTGSKEISENLAAFLNLDSVEKIASKRATGGTRPALDYSALFSIPVINKRKIYTSIRKAVAVKKQKEAEAKQLLNSIDDYLLGELGIELPEQEENTVQSRIFTRRFSEILGGRLDPELALYSQTVTESKCQDKSLSQILKKQPQYGANEAGVERTDYYSMRYIRITDINSYGNLIDKIGVTATHIDNKYILEQNDLLIARSGNTVGKAYLHKIGSVQYPCLYAGYMIRFFLDEKVVVPEYIFYYLHSRPYKIWVNAIQRKTGQPNINAQEYKSLQIPIPPLQQQTKIAEHITKIRNKVKQLKREAKQGLEQAKQEVEAMILGKGSNDDSETNCQLHRNNS